MRRPSGFILVLLTGVLVLAASAGGVFMYATRLPDPATADLRGVLRWLVTRDLSQEPIETQEKLLVRIEGELRQGLDLDKARDELSDVQRTRLVENADVLGRLWFFKQVDHYFGQPDAEKLRFLNEQIDDIQRSGIAKALAVIMAADRQGAPKNIWISLSQRIERWTARLEPARRAQAEQFVAAVQGSLLLRSFRSSFTAPS